MYCTPITLPHTPPRCTDAVSPIVRKYKYIYYGDILPHVKKSARQYIERAIVSTHNKNHCVFLKHNKDSICPVLSRGPNQEISPNSLSSPQMPPFSKTIVIVPIPYVHIRYDSVPYHVLYVPILNRTILYHVCSMPYNTGHRVIKMCTCHGTFFIRTRI